MFDPQVALAMFEYLTSQQQQQQQHHYQQEEACSSSSAAAAAAGAASTAQQPAQPELDAQQLAIMFAALKRERASRVTPQQRLMMYDRLAGQMDALPAIFLRGASDCQIQPLT